MCGFSAIYASLAQVLNEFYGKVFLPPGLIKTAGRGLDKLNLGSRPARRSNLPVIIVQ